MASSGSTYIPWNKVTETVPQGVQVPMCFCGSLCKLMKSRVLCKQKNFGYLQSPARKSGRASPLSLPPSFFLVSGILVMQMRGGGTSQPLYKGGRAGRPAAGRPGPAAPLPGDRPPRTGMQFSLRIFFQKTWPPGSGAAGYISVNFENENIFL